MDEDLKLIRIPLPYDGKSMEAFFKSFNLVRASLRADARVPPEIELPDAEDRFVTRELEQRRDFPVMAVTNVLRQMGQEGLLRAEPVTTVVPVQSLSEVGLGEQPRSEDVSEIVSISPFPATV